MVSRLKIVCIIGVLSFISSAMTGCVSVNNGKSELAVMGNKVEHIPERPVFPAYQPAEGSLWSDNGAASLYVDMRARRVGDTVTVDIVENTSSSMDANTKASRTSSVDAGISQMVGGMRLLEEKYDKLNRDKDGALNNTMFKAQMENKFDGKGTSDRSGQVTASIGAVVTEVLPNGNLVIYGRREMKVNNEIQFIALSGIIRPQDIDTDNRVKSTFIADARIEYTGKGVLADKQRPGWFVRALDQLWPF